MSLAVGWRHRHAARTEARGRVCPDRDRRPVTHYQQTHQNHGEIAFHRSGAPHCTFMYYSTTSAGESMRLQQVITVIGVHAEGEVGRVITGGVIAPRARSMFECQQALQRDQDWLRGMLLSDPRGSVNAAVNLVTPPISLEADVGLIVIEAD